MKGKCVVGSKGVLGFMLRMVDEMDDAKKLSDKELTTEVLDKVWSKYKVDSRESALLGEMFNRLKKKKESKS